MNSLRNAASSMQKTYDECYLTCSTAVYFEGQNNEAEALRAWRNALDQIYYHNAYKIPSSYTPKTETERALQDSLRSMELQCKERVDLLEALKKSREEASEDAKTSATSNGHATKGRDSLPLRSVTPSTDERKTWLGQDTVPQTNYNDLPVPARTAKRPGYETRPSYAQRKISEQEVPRTNSLPHATSAASFNPATTLSPPKSEKVRNARTPSPEKKGGMLRTLRSNSGKSGSSKAPASLRSRPIPAAAKAATQVWSSGSRQSLTPSEPPQTPTTPEATTWDPYTRSLVNNAPPSVPASVPTPERRASSQSIVRQPSPTDFIKPQKPERSRPSSGLARDTIHTQPAQSYLNAYRPAGSSTRQETPSSSGPPVPPHKSSAIAAPTIEADNKQLPQPPSLNQLGQAQPLAYMKEYPNHPPAKPPKKPEIDTKTAADLAISSSSRISQARAAPVARKAVGNSRAAGLVNAIAQRRDFDNQQNSTIIQSGMAASIPPVGLPSAPKPVVLEEAVSNPTAEPHDSANEDISESQWDAKVQALLKNLPKGVDEAAAKQILNEIVIQGDEVHWEDVAGLEIAKSALKETVVYPFLRPDLFMGLREPARGMLLFGPPGTGKTMLARAVATESRSVFFAISASSLTSKFLGESEKLVRALFSLAKVMAPSIIFVDEIDSLLGARGGSSEHEATRRIKTEFLIQWSDLQKAAAGRVDDKKEAGDATRVLVLAATNLPWAIDEAARRRFVRRQYIPLPEDWVRKEQLQTLLAAQKHSLSQRELTELVHLTDGFSGSDITALAKDAAMGPLRSLGEKLLHMSPDEIRPIGMVDFLASLKNIRPSVSKQGLKEFEDWAAEFGERGG